MKQLKFYLLGLLVYASAAHTQDIPAKEFAYGQMVVPSGDAAAYRFTLPLAVYKNTVREDLGDLRVFNGEGVAVPFSLSRSSTPSSVPKPAVAIPIFPLHEGARIVIDGVHLTINSNNTTVNLQTHNGATAILGVRQYLLDARALDEALSALKLDWPDEASEYTGRVSVEVSDDLTDWHFLVVAPIANLRANGQTLIENRVNLPITKAKFWRLSWLGTAPNFELTGILAEPAASLAEPNRSSLDTNGAADPKDSREYTFDLAAHLPVSRLNLLLPEPNSVMDIEIASRASASAPWRFITHSGFYRLKTSDGEQQNAPLEVAPNTDRYWRARIGSAGASPQSPLTLHVEWIPNEVTFMAQGHGPFIFAYGNASANRAETNLSQLPQSLNIAPATLGPMEVTGGTARLIAKPAPFPRMRVVLWSVLLLAAAILAWMAYRIARDPKDNAQA